MLTATTVVTLAFALLGALGLGGILAALRWGFERHEPEYTRSAQGHLIRLDD